MAHNEQESKINTTQEKPKETERKDESIVDHLRAKKEEQIGQIEQFNFHNIGYEEDAIEQNNKFRDIFNKYLEESGDDPKKFLGLLTQQGIRIVENSSFLSSQQSTQQFLGRLTGRGESGVNALFATQDMVKNYLSGDMPKHTKKELGDSLSSAGVILLNKRPNAKSIFHEGSHAIQYLSGMNMDARDEETKLRREIEVNTALIGAKNSGKLTGVSRGEYQTGRGPFGETATLSTNDIYQEVDYFLLNRKKLSETVLEKQEFQNREISAVKIEEIKKKLSGT